MEEARKMSNTFKFFGINEYGKCLTIIYTFLLEHGKCPKNLRALELL